MKTSTRNSSDRVDCDAIHNRSKVQRAPIFKLVVPSCRPGFGRVCRFALDRPALARDLVGGEHLAGHQIECRPGHAFAVRSGLGRESAVQSHRFEECDAVHRYRRIGNKALLMCE